MYKLPFTLVNGFVEYRWLRGFPEWIPLENPILKLSNIFTKCLIQKFYLLKFLVYARK
jgi:hypothetical protein